MTKGDTNGLLVLAVERGNEITIEYSKKEIINKINSYFGYRLINEIRLKTINSVTKKVKNKNNLKKISINFEKKINEIKNKNIRNSLSQLLDVCIIRLFFLEHPSLIQSCPVDVSYVLNGISQSH